MLKLLIICVGLVAMLSYFSVKGDEKVEETNTLINKVKLDQWAAPYRNWVYWPDHVIAAEPMIPGHEDFKNTDVPCVYQLPGQDGVWYMSYIAFNGKGYNSFVSRSTDLIHWSHPRLAMGFYPRPIG